MWDAAVSIDDKGWIAEMRIPFSQLRFPTADQQVWGLHVVRMRAAQATKRPGGPSCRRTRAASCRGWASWTASTASVSRRHLELLPYVTARSEISGTAEPGDPFNDGRTGAGSAPAST